MKKSAPGQNRKKDYPASDTPRKPQRKARRAAVIDAAAAVFAEKGYHGASTKDIAQRLGIQQGSLYYYFDSKEAALQEVCERGMAAFLDGLKRIAARDSAIDQKIADAVANHLSPLRTIQPYVRVFLRDRSALSKSRRGAIRAMITEYEALLEGILRTAVAAGELPASLDCRMATLALIGMCNAAATWYGRETEAPLERIIQCFSSLAIGGVHRPG